MIGSLSRTIQQYSPPSEWIMCELGLFPIFLEDDKILGLNYFFIIIIIFYFAHTNNYNTLHLQFITGNCCRLQKRKEGH